MEKGNLDLPKHIGKVYPRVRIDGRCILTPRPDDPTIFLEEAFERATAWRDQTETTTESTRLPGPPLSHIVISSTGVPTVGWKTKNSAREELLKWMGIRPEYISDMKSCGMSGRLSTK